MRKPSLRCSLSLDGTRVRCSFGPGSDSCVDVVAHYIAKAWKVVFVLVMLLVMWGRELDEKRKKDCWW